MRLLATALLLAGTLAFAQAPAKDAKKPAAAKAAPATKAEAKPAAGGFVGNKDSKTLHRAGCKMAAKLKTENKVTFATKAEAEKAGYKPCKVCKP
jgi:methylphosphotriester-DNA--protein-cysteine methyltransferase